MGQFGSASSETGPDVDDQREDGVRSFRSTANRASSPSSTAWHRLWSPAAIGSNYLGSILATASSGARRASVSARCDPSPECRPAPRRGLPLDELADIDLRARGLSRTHLSRRTAARLPLTARAWSIRQILGETEPDLVLFCDARSGMHRLLHFLARQLGRPTLHVGDGWLPGLMQVDPDGLDGDSSVCRRAVIDYRRTRPDRPLLDMTLAAWIGGAVRDPVADRFLHRPRLSRRLRASGRALRERSIGVSPWLGSPFSWVPDRPSIAGRTPEFALPDGTPVAVLLQPPSAPRVRLDSAISITPFDLAMATARAMCARSEPLRTMIIGSEELSHIEQQSLTNLGAVLYGEGCARSAATRALAVVTINHPAGFGAATGRDTDDRAREIPVAIRGHPPRTPNRLPRLGAGSSPVRRSGLEPPQASPTDTDPAAARNLRILRSGLAGSKRHPRPRSRN